MRNMKGFTLVELLAVIVILAIVALVTAPVILNTINDSRISGAKDKAWGTIEAVKTSFAIVQSDEGATLPLTVDFANGGKITSTKSVTMSGDKPVEGKVVIADTSGTITAVGLKFTGNGTFYCTTNKTGNKMCCLPKSEDLTSANCADKKQFGTNEELAS